MQFLLLFVCPCKALCVALCLNCAIQINLPCLININYHCPLIKPKPVSVHFYPEHNTLIQICFSITGKKIGLILKGVNETFYCTFPLVHNIRARPLLCFLPARHWTLKCTAWPCMECMCRLITEPGLPITLYHLDGCWQCSFSSRFVVLITEWITSFKRLCCMIHGDWAKWISVLCRRRTCSQVAMRMYAQSQLRHIYICSDMRVTKKHTLMDVHKHEHEACHRQFTIQ